MHISQYTFESTSHYRIELVDEREIEGVNETSHSGVLKLSTKISQISFAGK
jgi:hypothetical protein